MKFLCFADLHLGAGASLGREPGSRLYDQDAVLNHILGRAVEYEVDAILNAGDTFEGPLVTPEQLEVFADFVDNARRRGIPIVATLGNGKHDSAMRHVNGVDIFQHIDGITVYSRPGVHDLGDVRVACLPWVSPARLVARDGGQVPRDQINKVAADLIAGAAEDLIDGSKPTVLLMHGSLSGASLPTGISTDELHEPVVDVSYLLERIPLRAVVAGHIHVPQLTVGEGWAAPFGDEDILPHELATPLPLALYTGSPMPLNFGEVNTPHGVWILDVGDGLTRTEFVPIESRPLKQTSLDLAALDGGSIDPLTEFDGILGASAWPDVEDAIVKVSLRATKAQQRRLELARLREAVLAAGAHTVKVEVETVREDRARVESVTDELEPLEAFDAWAAANGSGDAGLVAAARERMELDLAEVAA